MLDPIHVLQRAAGLVYPELVRFLPENWTAEGIAPNRHRERQARLGRLFSHRLFSRQYPGVPGRIHLHDNMLMSDSSEELARYVAVGRSALENIEAILFAAGKRFENVLSALDFPSGYGRVLRHLVQRIDSKRVTACELEEEGVMFCAQEFGVKPLRSSRDLAGLNFPENYDLIWVGSLFTHLPPENGCMLLKKLAGQLLSGGIMVFSTQGPSCLIRAEDYGFMFRGRGVEFQEQFVQEGQAYLPYYEHDPGYGIAFYNPESIRRIVNEKLPFCEIFKYTERGLDAHQDVWAISRIE